MNKNENKYKLKNNLYIFKANSYLSIVQLLFFIIFFVNIIAISFFPKNTGFTINTNQWFEDNWINEISSFQELLDKNGWIIIYQSLIVITIWSFILFFLIQFYFLKNYFKISCCINNKKYNNCKYCNEKKQLKINQESFFIASIFGFISFPFWIKTYRILKVGKKKWSYLFAETQLFPINNKYFFSSLFMRNQKNKNKIIIIALYLLIFSSIAGLVMMWISYGLNFPLFNDALKNFQPSSSLTNPELGLYSQFLKLSPFLSTLTYFTQFTNLLCFFYAIISLVKPRANIFRNNTMTIHLATYITVVALVFWLFIFRGVNLTSTDPVVQKLLDVDLATTTILHATTPLTFILYAFITIAYNRVEPIKYWRNWSSFMIYPITYGFFLYSLPFFSQPSVYGAITNLNPNNSNEILPVQIDIDFPAAGQPWFVVFSIVLAIILGLVFFLFWIYAKLFYKYFSPKNVVKILDTNASTKTANN